MIAKLLQLAIHDVAANETLVLSSIQDGVDGAGGFFYTEEEDLLTIEDDQSYLLSMLCRVDIRVLGEASKRATLLGMVNKECIVSGVGIDGFFQFGRVTNYTISGATAVDTVKIVSVDQVDKSTVFRVVAQKRSTKAYVSGTMAGGVLASENLMAIHQLGTGTANMLYGMFRDVGTGVVSGDTLTMTYPPSITASALIATAGYYLYPFTSTPVFFSLIKTAETGTYTTQSLKLLGYDSSATVTAIATTTPVGLTNRVYVGASVPAGNIFIAGALELLTISANATISIKEPMIGRLNPQTYTKY
jgi:hypothetical protein